MLDLRQTKEYAQYIGSKNGWFVKKIGQDFVFIRRIPFTPFSIIKIQRPHQINFKKIDQLAKTHRAFAIYLEPNNDILIDDKQSLKKHGYRPGKFPNLPTKTIHLNLVPSEAKILAQMKKDARYSIKKAKSHGIKMQRIKNIKTFHRAWRKAVSPRRYVPSLQTLKNLKSAFGHKAIFLAANHSGKPKILAGTVVLSTETTAYYYYAFTSKEGRKKLAQYLLVWEAIRLAKKKGCKIFDFEGIYDQRFPVKTWKGFSHFKKSFGGKEIEYPGFFIKHHWPF